MCVYGLTVFLETPKSAREGRAPYLAISFILFVLLSISSLMDVSYLFRLLFDATSPENFIFLRERTNDWVGFASQVLTNVVCFIGDGLLVSALLEKILLADLGCLGRDIFSSCTGATSFGLIGAGWYCYQR